MKRRLLSLLVLLLPFILSGKENALTRVATNLGGHFTFSGYGMAGWEYHDRSDPSNEFKINKIILMGDARITDDWHAFLMYDCKGGTLHEYWTSYRIKPWFNVKLGQFKTPFTIENPISPSRLEMITQTSLATNYMIIGSSPTMMPGSAGRDLGLTVYGTAWGDRLAYDIAVMNGEGRNKGDANNTKDIVGRLTVKPFNGVSVSVSGIHGRGHIGDEYVAAQLDGVDDKGNFKRQRLAVGVTADVGRVGARAEYMWARDGKGDNSRANGGYITAVARGIAGRGLDLVASYDHLEPQWASTVNRYQAGVQYWFYPRCRLQVAWTATHTGTVTESALLTQVQVAF